MELVEDLYHSIKDGRQICSTRSDTVLLRDLVTTSYEFPSTIPSQKSPMGCASLHAVATESQCVVRLTLTLPSVSGVATTSRSKLAFSLDNKA